jgi:uncharacterized protein HemX
MCEPVGWIIAAVVLGAGGMMIYSLLLQKRATARHLRAMQTVDESISNQRESIALEKESVALLKEILKTLKEK